MYDDAAALAQDYELVRIGGRTPDDLIERVADMVAAINEACAATGALYIADEVQSGLGRTGQAFHSATLGLLSLGSCDGAVREALDLLRGRGVQIDYMRVRAFPFGQEVEDFLASHSQVFVVEQNRDAQLRSLLILETAVEKAKLHSILHYSGLPMSSSVIVDGVLASIPEKRLAVGG